MNIKTQGGENLLTSEEAASLLRVIPETVVLLAKSGKIDAFKIGRVWRIRRDSVERYISETSTQAAK